MIATPMPPDVPHLPASDMYTTVVDMIATLIHSAVVGDAQAEKPEENKRHYQTLAKKLRKVRSESDGRFNMGAVMCGFSAAHVRCSELVVL